MKARTRARAIALQVLYEVDMTGHLPGEVYTQRVDAHIRDGFELTPELSEFARQIIFGVLPVADKLDYIIAKYAPDWPFDQMASIDRNILRIAFWEFIVSRQTPVRVAINEAVELAKIFGSDTASSFVNGVLGGLAEQEVELVQLFRDTEGK